MTADETRRAVRDLVAIDRLIRAIVADTRHDDDWWVALRALMHYRQHLLRRQGDDGPALARESWCGPAITDRVH